MGTYLLLLHTFCSYFCQCSRLLFKVSVYHSPAACTSYEALANQNGMLNIRAWSGKVTKSLSHFTKGTSLCRGAGKQGICLSSFWGKNLLIKWKGTVNMKGLTQSKRPPWLVLLGTCLTLPVTSLLQKTIQTSCHFSSLVLPVLCPAHRLLQPPPLQLLPLFQAPLLPALLA